MILTINNKEFDVKVVQTDEDKIKGLRNIDKIEKNEGMLFVFEDEEDVKFEMDDVKFDLDIIFIDENKKIISIDNAKVGEIDDYFTEDNVKYVLEILPGNNFKSGDIVEFEDIISRNEKGLHVLNEDGTTQFVTDSNTQVFSRKDTKLLIKMAKDANEENSDLLFKKLGKKIFEIIDKVDNQESQYVELKK